MQVKPRVIGVGIEPIEFTTKEGIEVHLEMDGRLWVNTPTHCVVRIQGLPKNSLVAYVHMENDLKFLDIAVVIPPNILPKSMA